MSSRLFGLPPEIRFIIWKYVESYPQRYFISTTGWRHARFTASRSFGKRHPILQVCRLIRSEALPIVLRRATIIIEVKQLRGVAENRTRFISTEILSCATTLRLNSTLECRKVDGLDHSSSYPAWKANMVYKMYVDIDRCKQTIKLPYHHVACAHECCAKATRNHLANIATHCIRLHLHDKGEVSMRDLNLFGERQNRDPDGRFEGLFQLVDQLKVDFMRYT